MILLIDNYDSFVYNLRRYLDRLGQESLVVRNDEVPLASIGAGDFAAIIISPGPKAPQQAGQTLQVIRDFYTRVPMLGVCLGHQAICEAFGAEIVRAPAAVHGRSSLIDHHGSRLLGNLPTPFEAARYHSLVAKRDTISPQLRVVGTCRDDSGEELVMAVEHTSYPIFGVQFHPESILSEVGYQILANFVRIAGLACTDPLPASDFVNSGIWSNFRDSAAIAEEIPPVALPALPRKTLGGTG